MIEIKEKYLTEPEAKQYAIKFFPNYFGKDLQVNTRPENSGLEGELQELRRQYSKYCTENFTNGSNESSNEKLSIDIAYEYLEFFLTITNQDKFYAHQRILHRRFLDRYQHLIWSITQYHFMAQSDNSYGAKQNKTNEKLLYDISLLEPVLTATLDNISKYFKNITKLEEIDEFYCILINKIFKLSNMLLKAPSQFYNDQERYHELWNYIARSRTYSPKIARRWDLGDVKRFWRLERNKLVRTALEFYKELENINIALYYGTFEYSEMNYGLDQATLEVSQIYNNGIKNIINGPHYFCYLNEEEKQEIALDKFLKRTKKK